MPEGQQQFLVPTLGELSPLDVRPSAIALWMRADAGTDTTVDGGAVGSWQDKRGVAKTFTQGTAANKPLYRTNRIGGQPAIDFDLTNDVLTFAGSVNAAANFELYIVADADALPAARSCLFGANTVTDFEALYGDTGNFLYVDGAFKGTLKISTLSPFFARWHLDNGGGNPSAVFVNGALHNGGLTYTQSAIDTSCNIGAFGSAVEGFDGVIAEILLYNTLLTAAELAALDTYFKQRYSL